MWVVKLGGSLQRDPLLPQWLEVIATLGRGRVVLVPGGGRFCDEVLDAQAHWRFDDVAAHNMAILAMAQHAMMLRALAPTLRLAAREREIRRIVRAGHAALWLPFDVLRDASDELTSWEVTSDSLALWLAARLQAERLVVVKSCPVDAAASWEELSARGVLDRRFAALAQGASFPIELLRREDSGRLRAGLMGSEVCVG